MNFFGTPKIQQFTDLCSVSNISIIIMTEQLHGFYINGKAPWAQSDLPLSWLKQELDKERKGKQGRREFGIAGSFGQSAG
jgi:meckelin